MYHAHESWTARCLVAGPGGNLEDKSQVQCWGIGSGSRNKYMALVPKSGLDQSPTEEAESFLDDMGGCLEASQGTEGTGSRRGGLSGPELARSLLSVYGCTASQQQPRCKVALASLSC